MARSRALAQTWRAKVPFARGSSSPYLAPLILGWIPLALVVLLSLVVLYMSFVTTLPTRADWTLAHWTSSFRPYILTKVLPNTLIVGLVAVAVQIFFAAPLAWLLNRSNVPFRGAFFVGMVLILLVPGFVKAMGWLMLVNARIGILNNLLASILPVNHISLDVQNPIGIGWVFGLSGTPAVFFLISAPMRLLDPALEEAASVSGMGRVQTFLRVSLPLILPAILGAAIYSFMGAISYFEVPAILGASAGRVPVLATELFYSVHPNDAGLANYGAAGALGMFIIVPSLVALYFYFRVVSKSHRYAVITGKNYRPRDVDLGGWKYAGLGFALFFFALALAAPLLTLVWLSLHQFLQLPSLAALKNITFENYQLDTLIPALGGTRTLTNTLVLIIVAPIAVVFFSVMISFVVVRSRLRIRRLTDMAAMLPHAIPGLAFAFALFIVGLMFDIWVGWPPILGTLAIIIVANVLTHLSYATRITNAAMLQVHRELEEVSRVCGAGTMRMTGTILVPLMRPALVLATGWTMLTVFREVTIALFLNIGPTNEVIAVSVWKMWFQGSLAQASAGAIVMVLIVMAIFGVLLIATRGKLLTAGQHVFHGETNHAERPTSG
jgi:iron(III) transport system permease protein